MNYQRQKQIWLSALVLASGLASAGRATATDTENHEIPRAVGSLQVISAARISTVEPATGEPPKVSTSFVSAPYIACRAAATWMPSQMLRQRAKTIEDAHCRSSACQRQAARVLASFLRMQACAQEDFGAGTALRAYYSRVAIQQQLELADAGTKMLNEQLNALDALLAKGLGSIDLDRSEIIRRKIEVADQTLVAQRTDTQLRAAICQLADVDFSLENTQLEPLEVLPQELDCDALCFIAMQQRQDLLAWDCLCRSIDDCTAEMLSETLTPLAGNIPVRLPKLNIFEQLLSRGPNNIAHNIRREVGLAQQQLKSRISRSIHEKCAALQAAYTRIDLANQIAKSLDERIAHLEQFQIKGEAVATQLFEARGQLAIAQSTLNQRRLEARIAEVDLAEEVGGLGRRCCANVPWLLTNRLVEARSLLY